MSYAIVQIVKHLDFQPNDPEDLVAAVALVGTNPDTTTVIAGKARCKAKILAGSFGKYDTGVVVEEFTDATEMLVEGPVGDAHLQLAIPIFIPYSCVEEPFARIDVPVGHLLVLFEGRRNGQFEDLAVQRAIFRSLVQATYSREKQWQHLLGLERTSTALYPSTEQSNGEYRYAVRDYGEGIIVWLFFPAGALSEIPALSSMSTMKITIPNDFNYHYRILEEGDLFLSQAETVALLEQAKSLKNQQLLDWPTGVNRLILDYVYPLDDEDQYSGIVGTLQFLTTELVKEGRVPAIRLGGYPREMQDSLERSINYSWGESPESNRPPLIESIELIAEINESVFFDEVRQNHHRDGVVYIVRATDAEGANSFVSIYQST